MYWAKRMFNLSALIRSDKYLFGINNENLPKIISIVKEVSRNNFLCFAKYGFI